MDSNNFCLYHNDKLKFQQLHKEIQHAKLVPRPYVYRMGMAVCSCRRQKPDLQGLLQSSDLNTIVSFAQEKIHDEQKCLKSFLNSELAKGISTNNYSLCMLLYVLYQSYQNRSYKFLQGTNGAVEKPLKTKVEKPNKQNVYEMAVKRRLKKLKWKKESTIPIFPGNLMQLREKEFFKKLVYEYRKDIVLFFNKRANERTYAAKTATTHVVIHYSDLEMLQSFKSRLRSAAIEIQDEMDKRRKELRRFRRRIYNEGSDEIMDQTTAACAVKEERQTDFTRKLKKRRGSPPTSSPLADGQCFNCLGIFEGLKDSGSCQHHPGFLKDEVWTCCGKEANTTKPCYKDHQETGCNVSIHNWRQRKNSGRKSDTYSRCTAAEDNKLSRACVKPNLRHRTPGRHVVNMWDKQYGTKY